jgi:hypothetical protein
MAPNRDEKLFGRYNALVLLVLGFTLTTLVGGFLGNYFQERAWQNRDRVRRLESERAAATSVFEELSRLMDRRLYRMRRILWGIQSGRGADEMSQRWEDYREVLFQWNDNLNRNLALVQRYFGAEYREHLEWTISEGFRTLGNELERSSREAQDRDRLDSLAALADKVNNDIYTLDVHMIREIQQGNIGSFRALPAEE